MTWHYSGLCPAAPNSQVAALLWISLCWRLFQLLAITQNLTFPRTFCQSILFNYCYNLKSMQNPQQRVCSPWATPRQSLCRMGVPLFPMQDLLTSRLCSGALRWLDKTFSELYQTFKLILPNAFSSLPSLLSHHSQKALLPPVPAPFYSSKIQSHLSICFSRIQTDLLY